ncbi:MAG: ribosome maturation factor RimP [Gordonia sp. (in: high G+C Gram-positive bacteria)]
MSIDISDVDGLIGRFVTGRGFDLEDLTVSHTADGDDIVVVVDRDGGSSLDVLADLSRELAEVLDAQPAIDPTAYTLEVTSPGVDRPLTAHRHWRRVAGRKVEVRLVAGNEPRTLSGRVGVLNDDVVEIVVNDRGRLSVRSIDLTQIEYAVVDVDFSRPSEAELRRCGLDDEEIARRRQSPAEL